MNQYKDLAKFMVKIDRSNSVPDILPPAQLSQLYFGYSSWRHYGSLPGTTAILNRLNDTFNFVVLTNTRTNYNIGLIINDLNNTMSKHIQTIATWPDVDLFE
ncbi:MAG: hypothetical protein KF687_16200 [Cyclobacteriaceae bacterium]|nr:hypothetical protein [Cyclobacteriaceae bacterium]